MKVIKFLLVGGVNTVFGYTLFSTFIYMGIHYSLSVFFSTILGVIFNYFTFSRVVFIDKGVSIFIKFIFSYSVLYLINVYLIYIQNKYFMVDNMYLAGALAIFPMAILAYLFNTIFVFRKTKV
jgi:putative flippase GtrA